MGMDRKQLLICYRYLRCSGLVVLASALLTMSTSAEDSKTVQEEQAIRAAAKQYLAALANRDGKELAMCCTADGELIDELGNAHSLSELAAEVQQPVDGGPKVEVKVTASKIRFLTSDVAVEDGSSEVVWPDAQDTPPARGHFHATWVKQDGRWRLARLCEFPDVSTANLGVADLGWMVGTWFATSGDSTLEATVRWNDNAAYLLRETKAVQDGQVVLRSTQRIGLDPQSGQLKSWSVDSDGGHVEAVWTKEGDSWVEQATGVLPDGRAMSATAVVTFDGKDNYARKLLAARIQGETVPDQEVRFTRRIAP